MQTAQTYYDNESNWGQYAYMTLLEMVNRIERETTDQDSYLANTRRSKIVDVAKDGIRELNAHVDKNLKAIEITLSDSQYFAVPQDYVDWKRICLVDENFRLHTLFENNNIPMARGFLQDSNYALIYDGNGAVLEADTSNAFNKPHMKENLKPTDELIAGEFRIWPERGIIAFSEELVGRNFIIEYISDGLENENLDGTEIKFHKMIYIPLRDYIYAEVLRTKKNVPMSVKTSFRNTYLKTRHEAMVASMALDLHKLMHNEPSQTLRISHET